MEKRENDLMLNVLANPDFTIEDFDAVGLNLENTSLQDKSYYKNKASILKQFTNPDGTFNNKEFDLAYNIALSKYSEMSDKDRKHNWEALFKYASSNIWADSSEKDYSPKFKIVSVSNPTKLSYGLVGWEQAGKAKLSADELAQSASVLLNPSEAAKNPDAAKWGKDPHNGFFDYFTDTLVMAQWDEDGTHEDPITGEMMLHRKGEYKIGKDGTYYYEKLDGRDIYGKKVLNKMNVLTEEGSVLNKIDFLDSDDIHKSLGGTVMKNLILVGGMFTPYVGPAMVALSLVPLIAGITGTFGKMATGSENGFLSELEGFSKSWALQGNVSEESLQSTWTLENFINTIGDTMAQLKLQRFIFEKVPYLFKGKYAGTNEAINKLRTEEAAKIAKDLDTRLKDALKLVLKNPTKLNWVKVQELHTFKDQIANYKALSEVNSFIKGYNKLGSALSKGYMTAITVADTYGEAKLAGADDWEASLLTLGYGAAEAALLNTGIGEWILPELHADKTFMKLSLRGLIRDIKRGDSANPTVKGLIATLKGDKTDKRKYVQNVINDVKDFFKGEFFTYGSRSKNLATATIAGGLGEGVEEVTEEVLADVSKGMFNLLKWMGGSDIRMNSFGFSWEDGERKWSGTDIVDRYGMSFIGGLVGGSLTNLGTAYRSTRSLNNMTSQEAFANVVDMMRNGQGDELRKMIKKLDLDLDKSMSLIPDVDSEGNYTFKVDPENSQDALARKMMNKELDFIQNVLDSSETNLTDDLFLDKLTLGEWRFHMLQNSLTANDLLKEFNNLNTQLVSSTRELETLLSETNKTQDSDNTPDTNTINEAKVKKLKEKINETKQLLQDLVDGKRAVEFASRAYFEMTPYLHSAFGILPFPMYVQEKYGKKFDELDKEEQLEAHDSYATYLKSPSTQDSMKLGAQLHLKMSQLFANGKLEEMLNVQDSPETLKIKNAVHTLMRDIGNHLSDEDFLKLAEHSSDPLGTVIDVLTILDPNFKQEFEDYNKKRELDIKSYEDQLKGIRDKYLTEKDKINNKLEQLTLDLDKIHGQELDDINKEIEKINKERDNILLEIKNLEDQIELKKKEREEKEKAGLRHVRLDNLILKAETALQNKKQDLVNFNYDTKIGEQNAKIEEQNLKKVDALNILLSGINDELDKLDKLLEKELEDLGNLYNTLFKDENLNFQRDKIFSKAINIRKYILPLLDQGYLDKTTKLELLNVLTSILKATDTDELRDEYLLPDENGDSLFDENIMLEREILNLPESKLDAIINTFSLTTTGKPTNISNLLDTIYKQLGNTAASEVEAMDTTEDQIHSALSILEMLLATINSAMSDNISMILLNPFGFNANLNYIGEKTGNQLNLPVVSELTAAPVLNQLEQVKSKLKYALRLYDVNRGNKLALNDNSEKALVKAEYKSFKKFFVEKGDTNPFKDWKDFAALDSTIRRIVDTDKDPFENKDKKQIEQLKTEIRDALYNFFLANQDKLNDVDALSKVMDHFDFISPSKEMLNDKLQSVGDLSFLYSLISSAAMKTSDFYANIANTDFGNVAPLGPLIESLRVVMASILNRNIFRNVQQAILKSILNQINNMTPDEFAKKLAINLGVDENNDTIQKVTKEKKEVWSELLNIPKFTINLVNGSAGTGKTFAIFKMAHTLLLQTPLKDKKTFFVQAAKPKKEDVIKVANNIFGERQVTSLTLNELMNHFVKDYKPLTKDLDGNNVIPENTFGFDVNDKLVNKQQIKEGVEIPGTIFIDEISLVSDLDLELLNNWANANGITIITAGDFTQNTITALMELLLPSGLTVPYGTETSTSKFITSPKLNITMRSDNSVKTKNQQLVEQHINFSLSFNEQVTLEYFQNEDNLYGEKILFPTQTSEIDDLILAMFRTLKAGERITYIYDNENSDLYAKLKSSSFNDRINFMKGSDAQGDETRYAIVDLRQNYGSAILKKQAWRHLYTGITRAQLASLIVATPDAIQLDTRAISSMYSEKGYTNALEGYIKNKKRWMKEQYPNLVPLNYSPFDPLLIPLQQSSLLNNLQSPQLPSLLNTPLQQQPPVQSQPQLVSQSPLLKTPLTKAQLEQLYGPELNITNLDVDLDGATAQIKFIPISFENSNGDVGTSPIVRGPSNKINMALIEIEDTPIPVYQDPTTFEWIPFYGITNNLILTIGANDFNALLNVNENVKRIFKTLNSLLNKEISSPDNTNERWNKFVEQVNKTFSELNNTDKFTELGNRIKDIERLINLKTRSVISTNPEVDNFIQKYGITNRDTYINPSSSDINGYALLMRNSITLPNISIDQLILNHPFVGFNNLEGLISYLEHPGSVQTSTDIQEDHMFYMIKDNNGKWTIFATNDLLAPLNDYVKTKLNSKYEVRDLSTLGDTLLVWDFDAQSLNYTEELADNDFDLQDGFSEAQIDDINNEVEDNYTDYNEEFTPTYLDSMEFNVKFHSFNSLELGAVLKDDGTYELDPKSDLRIDGVNGLIKGTRLGIIDKLSNNDILDGHKVLELLGTIQNVFYNIENITDITDQLKKIFRANKSTNLMVNFGIKKYPSRASMENGVADNTYMHKSDNELVYGLDKTANNSEKTATTQLVAIIGDTKLGEFLEIPLFSLSNPISVIVSKNKDGEYNFPDLVTELNRLKGERKSLYEILKHIAGIANQTLREYIDMYTSGNYFLYRFGKRVVENGEWKWTLNTTLDVREWTPAKGFLNLGMTFSLHRGLSLMDETQLVYDVSLLSASAQLNLHDFIVGEMRYRLNFSDNIYQTPNSGILSYTDENGTTHTVQVLPGHNFILVSLDGLIYDDEDMLKYYIKQLNMPSVPKRVKLIYVIPPTATLKDWYDYIDLLYKGKTKPNYRIGYINTPHLILKRLMETSPNEPIWNNVDINLTLGVRGLTFKDFKQLLENLNNAYNDYLSAKDQNTKTEKLKAYKKLFTNKYSNTDLTVLTVLTKYVRNLLSSFDHSGITGFNQDNADLLMSKLGDDFNLYYTTIADPNVSLFGAKPIKEVYTLEIVNRGTLNDKPFKVHGKLDTYTFKGKIPGFGLMSKFIRSNSGKASRSVVGYLFEASKMNSNNQSGIAQNCIDSFTRNYGLPSYIVPLNTNKTVTELVSDYIKELNSNADNKFVVFATKNGKNWRINKVDFNAINKTGALELIQNNRVVTHLVQNNSDKIEFNIRIYQNNGLVENYRCSLENGNLIKILEAPSKSKPVMPSVVDFDSLQLKHAEIKGTIATLFGDKFQEVSQKHRALFSKVFGNRLNKLGINERLIPDIDKFLLEFPNIDENVKNYLELLKTYIEPTNEITDCNSINV